MAKTDTSIQNRGQIQAPLIKTAILLFKATVAKILDYSNNTKRPKVLDYSNNTKRPSFDIDRTKYSGIDAISANDLKKLNKNKKLTSSKVPTLVSYANNLSSKITKVKSTVKLPTLVLYADDLSSKITKVKSTVKF
ncbi:hypothetical protein BT67DRAFT_437065 [Trichocladium antarcticum]|uniref:Uncharacterized protein n=1 Tax=Trichocladium antarcticum TaxID=1450529 RepID=A0AAN6UCR2_9PEZI|nr:hypothetical protein BT67DRAFT_437065 [Trichocladium antarcticum]